jgi:hypothetical protein
MLRLNNAIAGLGAQLRDHAYYKGAMRKRRMARHVLSIEGAPQAEVGTESTGPSWRKKRKGNPRRSAYGLQSFSLLSRSGSLTLCSSR